MFTQLSSQALLLRAWQRDDLPAFAAMNADARVMQHFPACLSPDESDQLAQRIQAHIEAQGFGHWVVERREDGAFLGIVGLQRVAFAADFTPAVEIAWRFAAAYWGQGYALEAARLALEFGFEKLQLQAIFAFTVPANLPSLKLMQRLGMRHIGDFQHPGLPEAHPLRLHQLYRLLRQDWLAS